MNAKIVTKTLYIYFILTFYSYPIKIKNLCPDHPESSERVDSEQYDEDDNNQTTSVASVDT